MLLVTFWLVVAWDFVLELSGQTARLEQGFFFFVGAVV